MVVEIRDWCQNVGEYNTYNFCIWHFGLCVIVSKIDRCRSSDPPYEIAINPIFRSYHVSDVIIQSFLNRSRWNLVHTLVARRARSAISDCLVIVWFDRAYKEVSTKKYWKFSMAQFLWYDCTFKKQSTVPVTLTFDLWKSMFFQWIDNDPISVLYDVKLRPIVTKLGTLIENTSKTGLYDCHIF